MEMILPVFLLGLLAEIVCVYAARSTSESRWLAGIMGVQIALFASPFLYMVATGITDYESNDIACLLTIGGIFLGQWLMIPFAIGFGIACLVGWARVARQNRRARQSGEANMPLNGTP